MMSGLVDFLFGCWHSNYSFPITSKPGERRSAAARATGTYVVCLDCGKEFAYDWQKMKVVNEGTERDRDVAIAEPAPLAQKQAA